MLICHCIAEIGCLVVVPNWDDWEVGYHWGIQEGVDGCAVKWDQEVIQRGWIRECERCIAYVEWGTTLPIEVVSWLAYN